MNVTEYLLTCASEECNETAQRISKAIRFSMEEIQPGQDMTNGDRIMEEFYDLIAVIEKLQNQNVLPIWGEDRIAFHKAAKWIKIQKFLNYAKQIGTVTE